MQARQNQDVRNPAHKMHMVFISGFPSYEGCCVMSRRATSPRRLRDVGATLALHPQDYVNTTQDYANPPRDYVNTIIIIIPLGIILIPLRIMLIPLRMMLSRACIVSCSHHVYAAFTPHLTYIALALRLR